MKKALSLILIVFFAVGCMQNLNPANLKTPHARARFVNVTYIGAFSDYQRIASIPNLRPDIKGLLKSKRILLQNLHIGISVLNGHAETGTISDAMYREILNKMLELETDWYTATQTIDDDYGKQVAIEAGLISDTTTQIDPIFMGVLLELIRTGLHAYRAIMSQRNLDDSQMESAWKDSYEQFKTLNVNDLIRVQ